MDGSITNLPKDLSPYEAIAGLLTQQRHAFNGSPMPSLAERRDRLKRLLALLLTHEKAITEAISEDFGHRSADTTLFADIYASSVALKTALRHVKSWMKPQKRSLDFPLGLLGVKAWLAPQPKGVAGLITPWNFPVTMVFVPLAQMLAAGNRVMVKPSEHTPRCSALYASLMGQYFDKTELAVVTGGVEISQAFARQAFDHLMFTGAPEIGKQIMRAASENLVPVTLELGGKSPAMIGRSADMDEAAERIATMKLLNAGQVCLAPDYVQVAEEQRDQFVTAYEGAVQRLYPGIRDNDDYSAIISQRHYQRLEGYLQDAHEKGAEVRILNPLGENFEGQNQARKMPPALVLNPSEQMTVMQEEIFGPILPVRTYQHMNEAVNYTQTHERPLALYYFGDDKREEDHILNHTHSGGVTLNDCLFHGGHDNLPFGGIGNSGMGRYHGFDGFKEFSHFKPILRHPKRSLSRLLGLVPPYGARLRRLMRFQIDRL